MFECILFILIAGFIGVLSHYLHPIEYDGTNCKDETWHRICHVTRKYHHVKR
jgi:hypothetical protein